MLITILKYGIFLMIPLLVLTPEIRLTSPAIRVDEIILLFLAGIYLLYKLKIKKFRVSVVDYLFGALFVSVIISIFIAVVREGSGLYVRDLFELVKIVKYYLIYRIIFNIVWTKDELKKVLALTVGSFIASVLFSFMQYFNIFDINNLLMPYFTKTTHIRAIMVAGRVVGTFKNANSWALILGLPLFFIYAILIKKLEYKNKKNIVILIFFLFLVLTSAIMTMGRTSTVANFMALFTISASLWFFPYKQIGRPHMAKEIFLVFSLFTIISGLSFMFITSVPNQKGKMNIVDRFNAGFQEMGIAEEDAEGDFQSWSSRENKWRDIASRSSKSPIFGFGPSKSSEYSSNIDYTVDNEYLLYLYRYGLLGLSLYVGMFGMFLFYAVINLKNTAKRIDHEFVINIITLGIAVSYPLYNILAGSFYDFQLFPIYMIFNSLNIYLLNKNEKK